MEAQGPWVLGRYTLFDELASGGMATVQYGRLVGDAGFARTVVVKRLHRQFAKDPKFAAMFLDEARLVSRIRHPNVVQTLDVVDAEGELFLVMELVVGEALHRIVRAAAQDGAPIPLDITSAIVCSTLHGLHAAHEATSDRGEPLSIVHRDVSPSNVLVGADGIVRLIDFGVAKAANRANTTQDGSIKGKLSYMSPEQLYGEKIDRRSDVFATGVILWELLTGAKLFHGETEAMTMKRVMELNLEVPSQRSPNAPKALDPIVMRALQRTPAKRFPTAKAMALEIEALVPVASPTRIAAWVEQIAGDILGERARTVARIEQHEDLSGPRKVQSGTLPQPPPPNEAATEPEGTKLTLSTSSANLRPMRRKVVRWGSYAAVAMAAGAIGVAATRWHGGKATPNPVPAAAISPIPPSEPPMTLATSAAPLAATTPSSPPAAPSSAAAPTTSPKSPPKTAPQRHRPPSPASSKPCVPSYVDENGIKQYRNCP